MLCFYFLQRNSSGELGRSSGVVPKRLMEKKQVCDALILIRILKRCCCTQCTAYPRWTQEICDLNSTHFAFDYFCWWINYLYRAVQLNNGLRTLISQVACSIPLTPVWFSPALLVEMDKLVPSQLPTPAKCTAVPNGKQVINNFLSLLFDIIECKCI